MLDRLWRKRTPGALLVEVHTGAATVENSMEFPQETEKVSTAVHKLGLYPKNPETLNQKNLCTPVFIARQFTIAK